MQSKRSGKQLKIVLDTNNLISAQINKKGASFKIFDFFKEGKILLYTSPFQLAEVKRVLNYKRIKSKYQLSSQKIKIIINILEKYACLVYPIKVPKIISEDPDDDQILAIAIEGKVDFIVSGDEHLLVLKEYSRIPIISAREFLKRT